MSHTRREPPVSYGGTDARGTAAAGANAILTPVPDVALDEPAGVWASACTLAPVAVLSGATMFFCNVGQSVTLGLIGHYLTYQDLGGACVGLSLMWSLFAYPLFGCSFALDTLLSQIFGATPDSDDLGEVLQRSWLVSGLLWLPMAVATTSGALGPLVHLLFPAEVARPTVVWLEGSAVVILSYVLARSVAKFFNMQQLSTYPVLASIAALASSPFWHAYFIPRYGLKGAAIAYGMTYVVEFVVGIFFVMWRADTRARFGRPSFARVANWDGLREYFALGLPSMLLVAGEAAIFDTASIIAGHLGADIAAAYGVVFSISFAVVALPGGVSTAVCAVAGAAIGEEQPMKGRRFALVGLFISLLCGIATSFVTVWQHKLVFSYFTDSPQVMAQADKLLWLIPFFFCLDAVQYAFQGVFSALGRNDLGGMLLMASLWGVAFPLMLYWQHTGRGIAGVMGGMCVGMAIEIPLMMYFVFHRLSWRTVVSVRGSPVLSQFASVADLVSASSAGGAVSPSPERKQFPS